MCVTHHWSVEFFLIIRWWSSHLGQWPIWNLGSFAYWYIAIVDLPRPLLLPSDVLFGGGGGAPSQTPPPPKYFLSPYRIICLPGRHMSLSQHTDTPVPLPHPSRSVTSSCTSTFPLPGLPDLHCRHSLATDEITSNITPSFLWRRLYPPRHPDLPHSLIAILPCAYIEDRP